MTSRRTLLSSGAASLLLILAASTPISTLVGVSPSSSTNEDEDDDATNGGVVPISSLEEAIRLIESSCDKRFLHAVVASDYQLLYQEGTQMGIRQQQPQSSSSSSRFRQEERTVVQDLQEKNPSLFLRTDPQQQLSLQSCQLALSHKAQQRLIHDETNVVSIWPLMSSTDVDVRYAWPEEGGAFRSDSKNIVVDGVDCGRVSLEDALEGDTQVLVQQSSRGMLVIPKSMERDLIAKLQGAFLI